MSVDDYIYIKKIEKQSIPDVMTLFIIVKSTFKRFGFIKPSSGLYDGERIDAGTTMDVFIKIMGEEKES